MSDKAAHILIVDDELSMRELLEVMLKREGYLVSCAENGFKAIAMIEERLFDLLLCDIRLGDITGLEVLKAAKKRNSAIIVIMISAYSTAENAVEAMKEGAYDYVPKPFDNNELKQAVAKALKFKTVDRERRLIEDELKDSLHFDLIIGNHPKMLAIYDMIRQVAKTTSNVLITGESGTGKELIARAIHEQSDRRDRPFVEINCGSIPELLMESEFFGHRKGSFTGAVSDKIGLLEFGNSGTVFLDEIGEISPPVQVKLLKAVQDKAFIAVGGNENISVDIRILSATNKNLEKEVISGRFREDLFYRLNVIEIKVPPLRERKSDLRILAQHFLDKYSKQMGKEVTKISSYAIDLLNKYDFPGNIRELENLIERSVALSTTNILLPDSLAISVHKRTWKEEEKKEDEKHDDLDAVADGISLDAILEKVERAYIEKAMECANGNKKEAARLLGIAYRSLWHRLEKLGIKK
ncbi:MAG: Fis family transcriptional regulator [Desulfobacteraceae bacterium IS3]|nr:MAG: Fis family transcriptional regulator [Desulfobacteraceae bacterium IS3]